MALTLQRLVQVIAYDPDTGHFTRLVTNSKRLKPGCSAGTISKTGYVRIAIDGVVYPAHRLAWFIMTGEWPSGDIDHANGNRADNRWLNIRAASRSQNTANSALRRDSTSGHKGAYRVGRRWVAQIRCNGHLHTIGRFDTAEQAHSAYMQKARELFGDFARAG